MARILVGLSGGVDSSVAAALLVEQGHDVVGAYMKNWVNDEGIPGECPWEQDIQDALAVAKTTGIEFRVIDLVDEYRARIVNYLIEGYRAGYTPNPDVLCNREMKFGVFLDYALEQGFDYVATGHYARRMDTPQGAFILRGRDPNKDQSYFLSLMRPDQIARAVFPLGDLLKPEVRVLAEKYGLPTARKKDSQGICFIGQVKMSDFLRHYLPDKPGKIVDTEGRTLGTHNGLHLFTMGQRKGHGVASPREGVAYVVVGKDVQRNRLILGYEDASRGDCTRPAPWSAAFPIRSLPCRPASWPSPATGPRRNGPPANIWKKERCAWALTRPSGPWPWDRSAPFTTEASCSGAAFLNP